MKEKKLTDKQERFCKEYVISLNAADAARKAGYSKTTAHVIGVQNLSKLLIKKRLEQLQAPKVKKLDLTAEMVLGEMKSLAFSNIDDFFDDNGFLKEWKDITRDQKACLAQVDMILFTPTEDDEDRLHISQAGKLKFWDKVKSLNMLGNHLSLFQDKMDGDDDSDEPDERFM